MKGWTFVSAWAYPSLPDAVAKVMTVRATARDLRVTLRRERKLDRKTPRYILRVFRKEAL